MKQFLIILFSIISLNLFSQGIEPSSFQPTPYLGGVLRGVTPFVDEFTGLTYYLYVHDSLDAQTPYVDTIFMTDYDLWYIKDGDTVFVGNVIDSSFIYNVVSDTFALDMDIDSTNELQALFHQDNILVLYGAGPESQVDLTPYMDVDSIYMENYDLWYTKSGESGDPYFVGNVTDTTLIRDIVSDSSTVVENDYGTIIVESPANTFGITVDSSLYMTTYDGTQKQDAITGTTGQTLRFSATNTLTANSLLYNDGTSIGVGTTSPQSKLQVQGSGDQYLTTTTTSAGKSGFFFNYNNIAYTGMKIYYNANDANVYFDNLYQYDGVNNFGDVIWRTTPVTIGSQVTAMTLKGNGRLGLGTVLPSQLLHVAGNSRLTGLFYDGNNEAGTAGQILSSTGSITDWIDPAGDSTVVENDYGTIITESPANTYGIAVDSSKFATTYDINGFVSGSGANTQAAYFTGPSTLASHSSLTYNSGQWNMIGRFNLSQTASNYSVCIGDLSGNVGTSTGIDNFWLGRNAGRINTSGYYNFAGGVNAMYSNTTGYNNVAIGINSLYSNGDGYNNLGIGANSLLSNSSGYGNVALSSALFNNSTGYNNIGIGNQALNSNTTGDGNISLGWRSLYSNSTGNYNVGLGEFSLYNTTGSGNVGLGYSAGNQNTTASDRLYIENSNSETPLIGGDFSTNRVGINTNIGSITDALHVTGNIRGTGAYIDATNSPGTSGQVLSSTVTGTDWIDLPAGDITAVTVSAPITGGGTSGSVNIGIDNASAGVTGALTGTDWTTFNNKFTLPSLTSGSVLFSNGTTIAQDNTNFFWDDSNNRLGIGTATPTDKLSVAGTLKVTGSTSGNTRIWGYDHTDGSMGIITVGSGLSLSGDNLTATSAYDYWRISAAGGTAYAVTDDALIDFANGTGISWSRSGGVMTATNTGVTSLTGTTGVGVSAATGAVTLSLNNDLLALENLASTGFAARTASNTWAQRTITSGTGISIVNGNGVSGNPVITNSGVTQLTGTAPITVSSATGNITVGLNYGTGLANSGGQLVTYNPSGSIYSGSDTTGETFDTSYEIVAMGTSAVSAGTDISYGTNNISITSAAAAGRYEISYACCHDVAANQTMTYAVHIEGTVNAASTMVIETQNGIRNCVSKTFLTTLANGDTVDLRLKLAGLVTGNTYGNANLTITKI